MPVKDVLTVKNGFNIGALSSLKMSAVVAKLARKKRDIQTTQEARDHLHHRVRREKLEFYKHFEDVFER